MKCPSVDTRSVGFDGGACDDRSGAQGVPGRDVFPYEGSLCECRWTLSAFTHLGRTFVFQLVLCVVVCLGSPLCLSSVSASNRMVVVSPCSLASHIGGVGVRDAAAIAIGQCDGPRRPLGKDKYGGGEPYP